jgi:23S rRNA pseudouridine2605 synthase
MNTKKIRLNRYLAMCGVGSRRKCDDYIASGMVRLNGKVVTEMGIRIDPDVDIIEFHNENVKPDKEHLYILLNKPLRVVTTVSDEKSRKSVIDVVNIDRRIFPVGRLDFDTTGALLLTSDGKIAYQLAHPKFQVGKKYRILLNKRIRPIDLYHFRNGILIGNKKTTPCKAEEIRVLDNCSYMEVELHEGWNRQIRRMFEVLGYQVKELHRSEFAGLKVDNLKTGEWRILSNQEIRKLRQMLKQWKTSSEAQGGRK